MNLAELFADLDTCCRREVPIDLLCDRLERLETCCDELKPHLRFGEECYHRNLLHLGEGYAALLLCWKPGQASPIHDHRGSACALKVLQGTASERRYTVGPSGRLDPQSESTYGTGAVCGTYDADIHTMFNQDPSTNLVTLHVYTPPMLEYYAYTLESSEVQRCADQEVLAELRRRAS